MKRAWIPDQLHGLTRAAYDIAAKAGYSISEDYGALLMITRIAADKGLRLRSEYGIDQQLAFMVCFNYTSAGLHIAGRQRDLQYGTATLCSAYDSIGVEPSNRPQYVVSVHFVKKHAKVFRWTDEEEWRQAHPNSRSRSRSES